MTLITRGMRAREAVRTSGLKIAWDASVTPFGEFSAQVMSEHRGAVWAPLQGVDDDAVARAFEAAGIWMCIGS